MFEVGFTEILLILGLALLVLGPEKLPGLAKKIGAWTGRARAMANQLRTQLEQEVTLDELSKTRGNAGTEPAFDASKPTQGAATPDRQTGSEGAAKPGESQAESQAEQDQPQAESHAESHVESGARPTATAAGHSEASSTKPPP